MSGPTCARAVIVVVTHHGPGPTLRRCLDSLARSVSSHPVVVVDNSGRDALACGDYGPGVSDVVRVPNAGYGAAANAGVARLDALAHGDDPVYVALLNDDIEVDIDAVDDFGGGGGGVDWLAPLVDALDGDDRLGAVQPKLLIAGDDEPARVNSVGVTFDAAGAGSDLGYGELDGPMWADPIDIAAFTGGAVLLRRSFLDELEGFDERYFLYYEDVDLSLRGAERGWRYRCVPVSRVRHAPGSSSSALGDEVDYLRERNRLWTAFRFHAPTTICRACWLGLRRLRHAPRRAHARAFVAGLAGAPRRLLERRGARRSA